MSHADKETPAEDKGELPAVEQAEDKQMVPKTTKPGVFKHKAGCGSVGHSGACPVGPQQPIGVR
jgi:hypothetical protein